MDRAVRPMIRSAALAPSTWIVAAFLFLGTAWILTTPPAGGVDEVSHYIRTIGLAHGQLLGEDVDLNRPFALLEGEQLRRVNAESGKFTVPGDLPAPSGCYFMDATLPFDCLQTPAQSESIEEISLHGRSLPGAYVVPAIFSWLGPSTVTALMWARVGLLLTNLVMLTIIIRALTAVWRRSGPPSLAVIAVLVLSVTPVVAFFSATLAPSSTEIWSAAAFTAALFTFARTHTSWWLIATLALAVFASWTRDLGAINVGVALLAVVIIEPGLRTWWKASDSNQQSKRWISLAIVAVGLMSALLWQALFKYPVRPSIGSPRQLIDDAITVLRVLRQGIGLGGWLNVPLDATLETMWLVGWISAVLFALWRLSNRVRLVLVIMAVVTGSAGLYLVAMMRAAGFVLQARFLLPLVMVMVIIIAMSPSSTSSRTASVKVSSSLGRMAVLPIVFALVAMAHGSALLIAAHRHARGLNGRPIDFSEAVWTPIGGWTFSAVLTIVGCLCFAAIPWCLNFQQSPKESHVTAEHLPVP